MAPAVGVVDRDVTDARDRPPTSCARETVCRGKRAPARSCAITAQYEPDRAAE